MKPRPIFAPLLFVCVSLALPARAAVWSVTELHYQRGPVAAPSFAGGASAATDIVTLQGAGGHDLGDYFFFVDFLQDDTPDRFNDQDVYGELYVSFMAGALTGGPLAFGPVRDIGLVAGVNVGADANVRKWLPGLRFALDLPGFAFANLDLTAYLDDSPGVDSGGAPSESDSFMADFSWGVPFSVGDHAFSLEGHAEYIGARTDQFGAPLPAWFLAQPQLRYDLGASLLGSPGRLFGGVEWLLWLNKLGDESVDENRGLLLLVWRL
ncbi:MAG: nucleoside-binding protein [Nitrospinae bacterium]|nr:nucleoside-binding protein [Nitrospinota bacterium]